MAVPFVSVCACADISGMSCVAAIAIAAINENVPPRGVRISGPHRRTDIGEFEHRVGERLGSFLREIVSGVRYLAVDPGSCEELRGTGAITGGEVPIGLTVQRNGGHGDWRERSQAVL